MPPASATCSRIASPTSRSSWEAESTASRSAALRSIPMLIQQLVAARRTEVPLDRPHRPRARGPRADGRGPLQRRHRQHAVVSDGAVEKHVANIFAKLDLPVSRRTTAASSRSSASWIPDQRRHTLGHDGPRSSGGCRGKVGDPNPFPCGEPKSAQQMLRRVRGLAGECRTGQAVATDAPSTS